jgi:hypothetical protein
MNEEKLCQIYDTAYYIFIEKKGACEKQHLPCPQETVFNFHRKCYEYNEVEIVHLFVCMFALAEMNSDPIDRGRFIATCIAILQSEVEISDQTLWQWHIMNY